MSSLSKKLDRKYVSVAEFMADALAAYYHTRDPFGVDGDFITAPEISQLFGEMVGGWVLNYWHEMGRPADIQLVEIGPGRGTLMADMLRTVRVLPEFLEVVSIHLVETSPTLKKKQEQTLAGYEVTWHENLSTVPDEPSIFVTNELFDALPIYQVQKQDEQWHERCIEDTGNGLQFALRDLAPALQAFIPEKVMDADEGSIFEFSPDSIDYVADIAGRIARQGGAGLVIDYGHAISAVGETLQAVKSHQSVDILETPGEADITAHVDFEALAGAVGKAGAKVQGPVTQGVFLKELGIYERAEMLAAGASLSQKMELNEALKRLTGPAAMGELFKVMAITKEDMENLPGFLTCS